MFQNITIVSVANLITISVLVSSGLLLGCTGTGTVEGTLRDSAGRPIADARVILNDSVWAATDDRGFFALQSVPEGPRVLRIEAQGAPVRFRRVAVPEEGRGSVEMTLGDAAVLPAVDLTRANRLNLSGVELKFDANVLVDRTGTPARGARLIVERPDVRRHPEAMPGGFEGVDANGDVVELESFGVVTIDFLAENGASLQIQEGKFIEIRMPLLGDWDRDTIPLWHLNESTGRWEREGEGRVDSAAGKFVVARLPHLSSWNLDAPIEDKATILVRRFVDSSGKSLPADMLRARGLDYNGTSYARRTDEGLCLELKRDSYVKLIGGVYVSGRYFSTTRRMHSGKTSSSCATPAAGVVLDELNVELPPSICVRGRLIGAAHLGNEMNWELSGSSDRLAYYSGRTSLEKRDAFCLEFPAPGTLHIQKEKLLDGELRSAVGKVPVPYSAKRSGRSCTEQREECFDLGTVRLQSPPPGETSVCHGFGETVRLRDGREYKGCVVAQRGQQLIMKVAYGEISVPINEISSISNFR